MKHLFLVCFTALGCASTVSPSVSTADAAVGADASVSVDAAVSVDASTVDAAVSVDAGRMISDDCARGTWCWERPVPTGERAAGARAFSLTELVYVTRGGTVARWQGPLVGGRWRTARLALPAPVTGFWAESIDTLHLTCASDNAPGMTPRRWLVRVDGERATVLAGPEEGSASGIEGSVLNDLWTLGGRELLRWDGVRWERVAAPGDVLLSGLHAVGPGEVIALENWGSGSGFGVLHRYRDGAWTRLVDFRPLRVRVDGPIVVAEGALWMRAWDVAQSRAEIVRVDPGSGAAEVITPPTDESGLLLHAVGGHLWASYGTRVWDRIDGRWTALPTLPTGFNPVFAGTTTADAWFLGDVVARRATDGWHAVDGGSLVSGGRTWGEALQPVAGFWRDRDPSPALLTVRSGALAIQSATDRARWPLRYFSSREGFQGQAPAGDDGGWIADPAGVFRVRGRADAGRVDWPDGLRPSGPFGAWDRSLWVATERGIARYRDGRWLDPVPVPRIAEAPGQVPTVVTLHGVSPDTALVATNLVTGDKRVFVRVYALRGAEVTEVSALRGEFGASTDVLIAGALPSVWVSFDGLRRWDGARIEPVEAAVTPTDVHVLPDGRAVGVDGARVYAWSAAGRRVWARDVPTAYEVAWRFVRAGEDETIRVAASGGQVLRYTP